MGEDDIAAGAAMAQRMMRGMHVAAARVTGATVYQSKPHVLFGFFVGEEARFASVVARHCGGVDVLGCTFVFSIGALLRRSFSLSSLFDGVGCVLLS